MKIDLHIHTKDKNVPTRNISPEKLIESLKLHNVGVASITNHNEFDADFFNSVSNKGVTFIPGIELDILVNGIDKHMIVYSDSKEYIGKFEKAAFKDVSVFKEIIKSNQIQVLVSLHFWKDKERSFSDTESVESVFGDIKDLPWFNLMMEAPSKSKTIDLGFLKGVYHSAAFSDLQDWAKYEENAKDLPDLGELEIKNVSEYVHWFIKSKVSIFDYIHPTPERITAVHKVTQEEFTLDLFNGLNIIFGPKGSGKSQFLKSIKKTGGTYKLIDFSDNSSPNNLHELFEKIYKKRIGSKDQLKNINNLKDILNEGIEIPTKRKITNPEIVNFAVNAETYLKAGKAKEIRKNILVMNETAVDQSPLINPKIAQLEKIRMLLEQLYTAVSDDTYEGSLEKKEIKAMIIKNESDLFKLTSFDKFSFQSLFKEMFSNLTNSVDIPLIGIGKLIDNDLEYIKSIEEAREEITSKMEEVETEGVMFRSTILGDRYKFGYKMEIRDGIKPSGDDLKSVSQPKDVEETKQIYWKIMSMKSTSDVNPNGIKFSLGNIWNIWFYSSFGTDNKFMPSTGQFDMLVLDHSLAIGGDYLIDEFGNNLDNKYLYENIVPRLNSYQGRLVIVTHNPIIAVVPKVVKYIYKDVDGGIYKTYISDNYIFSDLKSIDNEVINTRNQLLNTIEGTKNAFDARKGTYES